VSTESKSLLALGHLTTDEEQRMALVADQSALKFESFSTVDSAAQALRDAAAGPALAMQACSAQPVVQVLSARE
jgi:hypothetical protein